MAELSGGDLVARVLAQAGVGHVFTLCGGHILPIYDGCLREGIRVVDLRHEQAAAHAADAYARLTRNLGVAIVTAGPGVTDAVTGVANAHAARSPLLLIGGAAPLGLRGLGALQEMEQVALLRPITKGAWSVAETRQIPEVLTAAICTALSGRPGPVFVEIPVDLLLATVEDRLAPIPSGYLHRAPVPGDAAAIERLARLLAGAIGGHVGRVLEQLTTALPPDVAARFADWRRHLDGREREGQQALDALSAVDDVPVSHYRWAAEIARHVTADTLVVGDGGDVVGCAAKLVRLSRPGQWLDPGPFGCLGVGPPFAIAAKLLEPARRVLLIAGDGAFGLNGMDVETAVRFRLPMTCIIGNDAGWGQIRNPQLSFFGAERAVGTSLPFTRFDQMMEALGGKGAHVTEPKQLRPALEKAMGSGEVSCVNVVLDPAAYSRGGQVSMAI